MALPTPNGAVAGMMQSALPKLKGPKKPKMPKPGKY